MKLKINKGSTVEVIAGSEKGKRGSVLDIDTKRMKIRIQGVKMMKHFDRETGIQEKEAFIAYSNVKLVEKAESKASGKKAARK